MELLRLKLELETVIIVDIGVGERGAKDAICNWVNYTVVVLLYHEGNILLLSIYLSPFYALVLFLQKIWAYTRINLDCENDQIGTISKQEIS